MKDPYQIKFETSEQQYLRRIRKAYTTAIVKLSKLAPLYQLDAAGAFSFSSNPVVKTQVDAIFDTLYKDVYTLSVSGMTTAWEIAVERNNELALLIYGKSLDELPAQYKTKYLSNNSAAKWAFVERKDAGLELSDKVWKNTLQARSDLELALEIGIGKGRSAAGLAKEITQYLNDPDKLFRRVRDEKGVLRLSKAAESYNPGTGRYRSSYKNAHRLASCEINSSYELSKQKKRGQQDFVVGVAVRTSPRHKLSDDGNGIQCSELAGDYPKDFDFTYKWHPKCRCFTYDILKTPEELNKDLDLILSGQSPSTASINEVSTLPEHYVKYLETNVEKWKNWKNPPRFVKNNPLTKK